MHRQQGLVGRDHMLARGNGFEHQRLGNAVAANQLNDDVNLRVGNHRPGVAYHLHALPDQRLGPRHIQVSHHGDLDAATGTPPDFLLVAAQHIEGARAHHANTQQANLNRFHIFLRSNEAASEVHWTWFAIYIVANQVPCRLR